MGQLKLLASLMMIALFSMAIVGYVINYSNDNDAIVNLGDEDDFSTFTTEIQSEVIDLKDEVNSSSEAISDADISDASGTIGRPAIFETMGTFPSIVKSIFNLSTKYLGDNPIITYAFTLVSIFIAISIVLYFWKTFKGNPD